ncbi:MAG: YfhO family protein [Butyrivibrio sp.]|nr:YfhO family protein [Butyrivibrio sp.]
MKKVWNLARIFILGFLMYFLSVLPYLISRGLPFFLYGDYNVQQIPFYMLAHRAIRNGEFLWNWNIDLGGSLLGSFAFYLMGSPFFWLTVPFPEEWIPYMMPFIMALKYGTATLTAYIYMKKHVRRDMTAVTGAILFAFSGFNAINIVFNHFTDAVAFFPLLLYTFDELMDVDHHKDHYHTILGGRRYINFVIMVVICSVINYYFFFGQVVFLIIYFLVRYTKGNRLQVIFRMILRALTGGINGVLLAGVFLIQAGMALTGNTRLDNFLNGYDTLIYSSEMMLWDIFKSAVMIPDIIGKGTLFYVKTVKNASLGIYMPMFGIAGVVAYFLMNKKKKDWEKSLITLCMIFAAIPFLNAMFSMFNTNYYARWFYMPILIMAMMTAKVVERGRSEQLKIGALVTTLSFMAMLAVAFIPNKQDDGTYEYLYKSSNQKYLWPAVIGTAIMCIMLIAVVFLFKNGKRVIKHPYNKKQIILTYKINRDMVVTAFTVMAGIITTTSVLYNGSHLVSDYGKEKWEEQMLNTSPVLDTSEFFRGETDSTSTNYDMVWGNSSVHCFLSTVPSEIFNFLEGTAGLTRTVETTLPTTRVGLRALLSTKYYYENAIINKEGVFAEKDGIPGYYLESSQNGFDIYENSNYIPMGFTFDYYITESEFDTIDKKSADLNLVTAIILSDEDAQKYGNLMTAVTADFMTSEVTEMDFATECYKRRETACTLFETSTNGFRAITSDLNKESLVFFSVPNSKGFTATVDGVETEIVTADYGLMAIDVPAGVHEIVVTYNPPYLFIGAVITLLGVLMTALYIMICRKKGTIDEY